MKFREISWMKKNAITASMWNLILAFAPNITADSMKN
jgi:hypothetical protein